MPKIAELKGVSILIHYREHPPPHIHARHAGREDRVEINPVRVMEGGNLRMPQRRMVLEWTERHQAELADAWQRAQERRPVGQIAPMG